MSTKPNDIWDKFKNAYVDPEAPIELVLLIKNAFYLGMSTALQPFQDLQNKQSTNKETMQKIKTLTMEVDGHINVINMMEVNNTSNKK